MRNPHRISMHQIPGGSWVAVRNLGSGYEYGVFHASDEAVDTLKSAPTITSDDIPGVTSWERVRNLTLLLEGDIKGGSWPTPQESTHTP